ncbi:hypothetical protein NQ315_016243 [Exocentrus adspersus]|uniref:Regulatory protein zeste n=1 Tax=Exocentrus adspersus TaxID=1586481 RepID=A0AAV8VJ41_9CUCU|nr:hypothetical protein NQ315_016243 [Exocentrus adspersus]
MASRHQMTREQKRYLLQYIEEHPELQSGKFTQNFTFKKAQSMWKELSTVLNSMPGAQNDWEKWRKTWHDMKNSAKAKGAAIKKHRSQTGGGPPTKEDLNVEDEKILNILSVLHQ